MATDPLTLLPELLLLAGAAATLLTGAWLPRERQRRAVLLAAVALAASLTTAAVAAATAGPDRTAYSGTYAVDGATATARIVIPAAALAVLGLATGRVRGARRETEFAVLVVLASLGGELLAGAADLLVLAAAYLLASIPLYALTGWARSPHGAEAALKLYLLGALLGVGMLLGITVLYALAGATDYATLAGRLGDAPRGALAVGLVALLGGLLFKAGAVPAHFWVPDAAAGATVPAAAFLTTVPKVGGLIALYRVVTTVPETAVDWRTLLAAVAAATMTLGNLAAFAQTHPPRLLGYSTISQSGYLLMAVAVAGRPDALRSLLLYLAAYAVTNVGAFAVVAAQPTRDTLRSYGGTGREHPLLAGGLVVCLLGLVGTPPTAVFVSKLTVFAATWSNGMQWLAAVAAANTLASLFYYLRWIAPTLFTPAGPPAPGVTAPDRWAAGTALTAAAATLLLGLTTGPVLAVLPGALR